MFWSKYASILRTPFEVMNARCPTHLQKVNAPRNSAIRESGTESAMLEVFLRCCRRYTRSLFEQCSQFRENFSSGSWGLFFQIRSQLWSIETFLYIHNNWKELGLFPADSEILTQGRKVWWCETRDTIILTFNNVTLHIHKIKENMVFCIISTIRFV